MTTTPTRKRRLHPRRRRPGNDELLPVAPGDVVVACDGRVGRIVRVLRTEVGVPRHVIVSAGRILPRYPVLSCELITRVDPVERTVHVRGRRRTIRRLQETLPFVL